MKTEGWDVLEVDKRAFGLRWMHSVPAGKRLDSFFMRPEEKDRPCQRGHRHPALVGHLFEVGHGLGVEAKLKALLSALGCRRDRMSLFEGFDTLVDEDIRVLAARKTFLLGGLKKRAALFVGAAQTEPKKVCAATLGRASKRRPRRRRGFDRRRRRVEGKGRDADRTDAPVAVADLPATLADEQQAPAARAGWVFTHKADPPPAGARHGAGHRGIASRPDVRRWEGAGTRADCGTSIWQGGL